MSHQQPRLYRGGKAPPPPPPFDASERKPYVRRPESNSGSIGTKWGHDLFEKNSSVLSPALSRHARPYSYTPPRISNSLNPFGSFTPPAPMLQTQRGNELFPVTNQHIVVKGAREEAETRQRLAREEAENQSRRYEEERVAGQRMRASEDEKARALEASRAKRKQLELLKLLALEEEAGTVVEVQGLVEGTSSEDVKTAFQQFGLITYCDINDPISKAPIARIVFVNLLDAQEACERLHGAVADGQTLTVQVVPATQSPFSPVPPAPGTPVASTSRMVPNTGSQSLQQENRRVDPSQTHEVQQPSLSIFERMGNFGRAASSDHVQSATTREAVSHHQLKQQRAVEQSLAQRLGLERTVPIYMPPTQVAPLVAGPKLRTMYADMVQEIDPRYRIVGVEEIPIVALSAIAMDVDSNTEEEEVFFAEQPPQRQHRQRNQPQQQRSKPSLPLSQQFRSAPSNVSLTQRMGGPASASVKGTGNGNVRGKKLVPSLLTRMG